MRILSLLAIYLLLTVTTALGEDNDFVSPEGGFAARFPAAPEPFQEEELRGVVSEASSGVYTVMWTDLDPAVKDFKPEQVREVLAGAREAFGVNPTERAITLSGHQGLDLEVVDTDSVRYRVRLYLVGRRLYQVIYAHRAGEFDTALAEAFVTSFRLLTS
ncbi:MAG: hypothetical protein HY319_15470 [Armatimonadetes bacterium]|nr:hypothetical protein [Armatimonadota bacterium]